MTEDLDPAVLAHLAEQAQRLRVLHHGEMLVLPTVWDAASAKVAAAAGFPALATGSAPISESLGYPDHEGTPPEEMFAAARRIIGAVEVPVTVDVEAGYGFSTAELVQRLIEVGASGCNIEDSDHWGGGLIPAETQANRLAALRSAAFAARVPMVINARVDVFVQKWGEESRRLGEAIRRARMYLDAGADCVYPILVSDVDTIRKLTAGIPGPVNVLYRRGMPSLRVLAGMGVARVTFGPGLQREVLAALRDMLNRIASGGDPFTW
ncbi:MAG TPA: isocitrate lyase/phosphoenolpyruvate mutase family protein [Micromonosporaceae bacterium]